MFALGPTNHWPVADQNDPATDEAGWTAGTAADPIDDGAGEAACDDTGDAGEVVACRSALNAPTGAPAGWAPPTPGANGSEAPRSPRRATAIRSVRTRRERPDGTTRYMGAGTVPLAKYLYKN